MSMMERQQPLGLDLPESVAIVGTGGVGSWTAYFLALAGVPEIWLFDMDIISEHNLNRIPLPITSVGKKKTEAVAELIRSVRPDCVVLPMGLFTKEIAEGCQLNREINWIIATTDTLASRQLVYKWAQDTCVRYIEAAAEGEFGSCTGEPAEWSTPQESQPGYQTVPVWVGPCVFAAAVAVDHVIHSTTIGDRAIRLGWQKDTDEEDEQFVMFDSNIVAEEEEEEENV